MSKHIPYSIYIYNPIEDEWPFISSLPKKEQIKYIKSSNRFADCYLFANALLPEFTLITPNPLDADFVSYFHTLSGSVSTILNPAPSSPFICESIMKDKKIFSEIVLQAKNKGGITIYAYAVSKELFALVKALNAAGAKATLPEAPREKDLWTVEHFGSKSGFRSSFPHLMTPGSVHTNKTSAVKAALATFEEGAGVVMKTDKGNAGRGIYIFKKNKNKRQSLRIKLKNVFTKDTFLSKHPIVIESFIDTSAENNCPFPSIEVFIHHDGEIEIPYYCNMIVSPEGEFFGMEMHKSVFTKTIKKKVLTITKEIAEEYRSKGYRGRFDIDMLCDGKRVYAGESNTRINGGTDTYMIVKKLIGKSFFSARYIFAHYLSLPKGGKRTVSSLMKLLNSYLYDKKTKYGLIINSGAVIASGGFSYIIIEKNKEKALQINKKIVSLLTNNKNNE